MKKSALYFEEIQVRRAATFRAPGFAVTGLAPGINIIYGPNASGKTTLARALLTLLWPDSKLLEKAEITGSLRLDDELWRLDVQNNTRTLQRQGLTTKEGLSLPAANLHDRYYLCLKELLEAHHRPLARTIVEESVGGFDLLGAAETLGFTTTVPRAGKATRAAREAQADWKKAHAKQKSLHLSHARHQELTLRLQELTELEEKRPLLERALASRLIKDELHQARLQLQSFPFAIKNLRGDEPERLKTLRQDLAKSKEQLHRAQTTLADCQKILDDNFAIQQELPPDFLNTQRARAQELAHLEELQARAQRELATIKARHDDAWTLVGDEREPPKIALITSEIVGQIAAFADEADQIRATSKALDALENLVVHSDDPQKESARTDAIRLLRAWLRQPPPQADRSQLEDAHRSARSLLLLASLLFAAIAIALTITIFWAWAILLIFAALFGWAYFALSQTSSLEVLDQRRLLRREFEQLSIAEPTEWTEESVSLHLRALEEAQSEAILLEKQADLVHAKASEKAALHAHAQRLETHLRRLTRELGLRPQESLERSPARLYWYLNHLRAWQESARDLAAHRAAQATTEAQIQDLRTCLQASLHPFIEGAIADAAQAKAHIQALQESLHTVQAAKNQQKEARATQKEAELQIARQKEQIFTLFQSLELQLDDDLGLNTLLEQLNDYQRAARLVADKEATLRYERARLRELPGFDDEILDLDSPSLRRQLQELKEALSHREDLLKERQDLETRIDEAKTSQEVAQKRAIYEDRLHDLRHLRTASFERTIGAGLVSFLHEEARHSTRSPLFHRAKTLFSQITQGRYQLLIDDGQSPHFRALDTYKKLGQSLDELSSGTRAQLLLSVRTAFIEEREEGPKLPLILDETLANSDDQRAHAIMHALLHLSTQGRQIFYLTAQQDEVQKWRTLQEDSPLPFRFVELCAPAQNLLENQQT